MLQPIRPADNKCAFSACRREFKPARPLFLRFLLRCVRVHHLKKKTPAVTFFGIKLFSACLCVFYVYVLHRQPIVLICSSLLFENVRIFCTFSAKCALGYFIIIISEHFATCTSTFLWECNSFSAFLTNLPATITKSGARPNATGWLV